MIKKILQFFILMAISSSVIYAEDCAEVNLQTQKDSPFQQIPVYNQDGLGSCYAYAASQLIDYARLKKADRKFGLTHPVWLALNYATYESSASIEGGGASLAINYVIKNGACKEDLIKAAFSKYKKDNKISDAELANFIETIHEVWNKPENKTIQDVYDDANKSCYASRRMTTSIFPEIFKDFKREDGLYNKVIPTVLLDNFLNICHKAERYKPDIEVAYDFCETCDDNTMNGMIKGTLKAGKPVGISYCASILSNKSYRGIDGSRNNYFKIDNRSSRVLASEDIVKKGNVKMKGCGRHASLIVGSRKVGGKCQYLLRNSWGSTSYKDHPNCLCEVSKGKYVDCKHGDGKPNKVGCWINQSDLTPNIYRLTSLKD